jgi:hypothetical protein
MKKNKKDIAINIMWRVIMDCLCEDECRYGKYGCKYQNICDLLYELKKKQK